MSMIATCVSKAQLVRISCPPRAVLLDLHLEHLVNHEGSYHPWNPFVLLTRGAVGQDIMSTSGRSVGSSPRTSSEPRRQLPPLESIRPFDQGRSWGTVGQNIMSTSGLSVGSSPRTSGEPRRQLPPLESICPFDQGRSWSGYHVHLGAFCWIFTSNI
ncbi:hypothetical protein RRG08_046398 [Elysia crispata]|uniref:Uncharacterized protein n=1 Tax=Elysia crispata TaxID=231223 RepID=A0AAE1A780_9GAST|nr:hypothetical protein RRG08_046398 [Elysia crispata]